MHESLFNEPVSTSASALHELLSQTFKEGQFVVLLLRYAYHGGVKDYYLVRTAAEFDSAMKSTRERTSITVFFESNFKLIGTADDELCAKAVELLSSVKERYGGVDLIRIDGTAFELDEPHFHFCETPEEICEWFRTHHGAQILAGTMEFWRDNCPEVVTAYVPDEDGVIRPGAY